MHTAERIREYFRSTIGPGRRFSTNAALARFLGLERTTATKLFSFLKGADTQYSSVVDWLEKLGGQIALPEEGIESYAMVPKVSAQAGAGESLVTSGKVRGFYAFRNAFLQREKIHHEHCVLMVVAGDSMEPLIRDGDTILVDESDNVPKDGYIFVVGLGDSLMVKRLAKIPHGWKLCSENRDRSDTDIQGDELDTFRVYGRVRWFGRVL